MLLFYADCPPESAKLSLLLPCLIRCAALRCVLFVQVFARPKVMANMPLHTISRLYVFIFLTGSGNCPVPMTELWDGCLFCLLPSYHLSRIDDFTMLPPRQDRYLDRG